MSDFIGLAGIIALLGLCIWVIFRKGSKEIKKPLKLANLLFWKVIGWNIVCLIIPYVVILPLIMSNVLLITTFSRVINFLNSTVVFLILVIILVLAEIFFYKLSIKSVYKKYNVQVNDVNATIRSLFFIHLFFYALGLLGNILQLISKLIQINNAKLLPYLGELPTRSSLYIEFGVNAIIPAITLVLVVMFVKSELKKYMNSNNENNL